MIAGVPYDAEIEYLESTGTQWIDTGFLFNSDSDSLRIEYTNESETIHRWVFGAYSGGKKKIGISSSTVSAPMFWYEDTSVAVSKSDQYFTRHVFEASLVGVSNDGSKLINFASFSTNYRLYIFGLNNSGNAANFCNSKIYRYTHTRSGVKILDFIPVRVGQVGYMYDRVTRKLFGNEGTGAFVLGPDVATPVMGIRRYAERSILPSGARWVEWLGSTESQWIDTGLILSAQDSVGLRVGIKAQSALNLWPLGCKTSFSPLRLQGFRITSSTSLQGYVNSVNTTTITGDNVGQTYDISMSNGTWTVNGVAGTATTPADCVNRLTLFGWNNSDNSEGISMSGLSAINLHRFYVERGNKRTIDLCPIAIGTTGYMLDLVSGEYLPYGNKGTGDFVIGPDISEPTI